MSDPDDAAWDEQQEANAARNAQHRGGLWHGAQTVIDTVDLPGWDEL